jgi:hypothetical protein
MECPARSSGSIGVSSRDDDLVAVLENLPRDEFLVGDGIGDEADIVHKRRGPLHDQLRRQDLHRHPYLGVYPAETVEDEREVVGAEALAGEDPDEPALPLLEIPEALLRLVLHLEDRFGDPVEDLSHFPPIRLP